MAFWAIQTRLLWLPLVRRMISASSNCPTARCAADSATPVALWTEATLTAGWFSRSESRRRAAEPRRAWSWLQCS